MKRMVKNGDLIDVEPDGTITVAGKPIGGGGGGSNDREITLTMPYSSDDSSFGKKLYINDEIRNNITNCYYNTINLYYNDDNPLGVFHVFKYLEGPFKVKKYLSAAYATSSTGSQTWFGSSTPTYLFSKISLDSDSGGNYLQVSKVQLYDLTLQQSKFDALYKLADKPTQDGTYVLKATVSGGAVTYTWVAQ